MQRVKRFLEVYGKAKRQTCMFLFYSISMGLYNMYFLLVVGYITSSIEVGDKEGLVFRLMIIGVLVLLHFLFKVFIKSRLVLFDLQVREYLDRKYLKKFLLMNNNYAESLGTGRLISLIQKGVNTRVLLAEEMLWGKLIMTMTVIFSLGYVGYYYPIILIWTIVFIIASIYWIKPFASKALQRRKKRKDLSTSMDRTIVRRLMSKFEILQSDTYDVETQTRQGKYNTIGKYFYNEKIRQAFGYDVIVMLSEVIYIIGIIYFIGNGVIDGIYSISEFVIISGLGIKIQRNIFSLQMEARRLIDQFIHIDKLRELFDGKPMIEGYESGDVFMYMQGKVNVSNVSYRYATTDYVFKDFSLTISGGKKTALVGVSGSGKSTLVKLIAGYLKSDHGSISVDDQDLNTIALKSYYPHIGYLTQEPSVFDGTIRENLTYAVTQDIEEEKVQEAIQLAHCEFVYDLPYGLDTEIGERGVKLSGGQRQRLAIAKIFLKNPEIIILDEPTSALDSFSEEAITKAMHRLFENRTVIIIAHRLQTVKEADDIVLLGKISEDEGAGNGSQVLERGTHDELVALGGQYARMLEVQTGF